ncbi:pPIWI_RE_Z domain-containing protein [Streptomyces paludis]|uniref:pPIWI-RE three-gene island domain-containing protein n=1 Tax=Streptomyces paludis TaxID=2282738 RepID=A0A345HX53_9ACTN|nr:hypothetical protein [Streptomyces paludis]AXG81277.1 hypothetical protein DVK44_30300 [Streptomyces paludis]
MRDRSGWYSDLVKGFRPWPQEHAGTKPALLCQVELGLRLLETLDPGQAADGVWVLLGGYPFAQAAGIAAGPAEELALVAARHLLWPLRRRRMWQQSLDAYLELPERLRGYRVPLAGGPARRVDPPVASYRFGLYDKHLGRVPDFSENPLPRAGAGSHRFLERGRYASVSVPEDLVLEPAVGHPLVDVRTATAGPLDVPLTELAETAGWMDAEESRKGLRPGNWSRRLGDLQLDTRASDGIAFEKADRLTLHGLTHLVGMVGAGKSTLMSLIAVWGHRKGLRTTLVVGDVAEQLTLTEIFRSLGLSAAPIQGNTTREQHTQRLHRRLSARGESSLLAHQDRAFDLLSTACPLDAERGLEAAVPLRYADAPCGGLHPVRQASAQPQSPVLQAGLALLRARGAAPASPDDSLGVPAAGAGDEGPQEPVHACPLWSACPRHSVARDLVDALIWVANPASLVLSPVPRQLNAQRLRYLELACLRSDMMIVDEVDRVQMTLDRMFAPSATLVTKGPDSWLDRLQTDEIAELARQGRLPLSDRDVERWSASLDVVSAATNRLYAMLISDKKLRDWAQIDYFSAWTLQEKLLHEWYPAHPSASGSDSAAEAQVENEWELYEDDEELDPAFGPPVDARARRRQEVTRLLDAFRDDPLGDRGPYGTETDTLIRLAHDLLHTLIEKNTRRRVRTFLDALLTAEHDPSTDPADQDETTEPDSVRGSEAWFERAAWRLEFTLILAVLHQRLDRLTFPWPQVEAALHLDTDGGDLTRRPPLDYAPLVPEAPMGNVLGFQYLPDEQSNARDSEGRCIGTLRFFRCAGVGRELLLNLPDLGADHVRGHRGPHVLLMSGTSWAGTSTRAHVLAPVRAVLKPNERALQAIRGTSFRTEFLYDSQGGPIRLSGQDPDTRPDVLRLMIDKLARPGRGGDTSPLQRELAQIGDARRRRALLLVGSYREATAAAEALRHIPRWQAGVRVLAADDAELDPVGDVSLTGHNSAYPDGAPAAGVVRRGDLASFAEDPDAEILVAPLLAIERGHNILTVPQRPNEERVAAFGTVFFLVRPHPRPDDLSLAIFAINDWATRFVRDHPGLAQGTFGEMVGKESHLDAAGKSFRTASRREWRHLLSRQYMYSRLSDGEKWSFAWDQLVAIWQVIGRLVRGGVPARVVFVDAAFAPLLAASGAPLPLTGRAHSWLKDPGLLVRLRQVLAPYFRDGHGIPAADAALVRMLYQPLYEALDRLHVGTTPS